MSLIRMAVGPIVILIGLVFMATPAEPVIPVRAAGNPQNSCGGGADPPPPISVPFLYFFLLTICVWGGILVAVKQSRKVPPASPPAIERRGQYG